MAVVRRRQDLAQPRPLSVSPLRTRAQQCAVCVVWSGHHQQSIAQAIDTRISARSHPRERENDPKPFVRSCPSCVVFSQARPEAVIRRLCFVDAWPGDGEWRWMDWLMMLTEVMNGAKSSDETMTMAITAKCEDYLLSTRAFGPLVMGQSGENDGRCAVR